LFQTVGGTTYEFDKWADNATAPALRTVRLPASNVTYTANYKVSTTIFVSDLTYTVTTNGWGPVEKDKSNGEQAAGDGHTLTLNGVTYAKGLGVHAASEVRYNLGANCNTFTASV